MTKSKELNLGFFHGNNTERQQFQGSWFTALFSFVFFIMILSPVRSQSAEVDWPNRIKKFFTVDSGHELYVDFIPPERNHPTLVLLNGLTYSTSDWDALTKNLRKKGFGVFRYDMYGMGKTLVKHGAVKDPVPYQDQLVDLANLLDKFNLGQNIHLIGLSYGGAIALEFGRKYPERISELIVMAPYIAPLEQQDKWIKTQVWVARNANPFLTETDDELYDFFLKQFIYSTYPLAEPAILENQYKLEAVFHLVQGIRKYNANNFSQNFPENMHLMIGKNDQYISNQVHLDFWNEIPANKRSSLIVIENCEHKIPEAVPLFASQWIAEIVTGNLKLRHDARFVGFPFRGEAKSNTDTLIFPVEE